MRKIFLSIALFTALHVSCFAQWNNFLYLSTYINIFPWFNGDFNDANFIAPGSGLYGCSHYVSPSSGTLLWLKATVDTGNTWNEVYNHQDLGISTYAIEAVRNQNTYFRIWNWQGFTRIEKSTNNGFTWNSISAGNCGWYKDFSAIDTSHFFLLFYDDACTNPGKYYINKLQNGTISIKIDSFINENPSVMFFADTLTGYIAASTSQNSNNHLILKSTTGGIGWTNIFNDSLIDIREMYFLSPDTGYAAGSLGKMLKTVNGGFNWQYLNTGVNATLRSIYFLNDSTGFAAGDSGVIIRTTDGGTTWNQDSTWTQTSFKRIFFFNDSIGYAIAGQNVFRINLLNPDVGVWEMLNAKENVLIYPNPTSGIFTLQLSNQPLNNSTITVFNILGDIIFKSEIKNQKSEIDLSSQPKGIYFVKVIQGDRMVVKKIAKM